jgi:hypothetical protein
MDYKNNIKKLLCYNIVNNCKCVYKNKCMFAHTLDEQKKENLRQYVYDIIYEKEDLSDINLLEDKNLLEEIIIFTKECKNCMNKKCPGGYNCKFGVCLRENKICYNDIMNGKCYNITNETIVNGIKIVRCIHGIHLTERKIIPYHQRLLVDMPNSEPNVLTNNSINYNSKMNIISLQLNDSTINFVKDLIYNKINKMDLKKNNRTKEQEDFYLSEFIFNGYIGTNLKKNSESSSEISDISELSDLLEKEDFMDT